MTLRASRPLPAISAAHRGSSSLVWWLLAGLIGGGWYWYSRRNLETTDDAFIDGRAITMAPQVKGRVIDLAVTDNQFMHAGDVLLRIDPRDYAASDYRRQHSLMPLTVSRHGN